MSCSDCCFANGTNAISVLYALQLSDSMSLDIDSAYRTLRCGIIQCHIIDPDGISTFKTQPRILDLFLLADIGLRFVGHIFIHVIPYLIRIVYYHTTENIADMMIAIIKQSRLDATAITMVKKHEGDLGKQRLFGVIGQAVFVEFSSFLISISKGENDLVFYSRPWSPVCSLTGQLNGKVDCFYSGVYCLTIVDVKFFVDSR